jgi:uncharacterized protein
MNKIQYCGNFLVITNKNIKILVIGDLHLGYEAALRITGVSVHKRLFEEIYRKLDKILYENKKFDLVIFLGDIKHSFGNVLYDERKEAEEIIQLLKKYTKKIIIVRGNHDTLLKYTINNKNIKIVDYFIYKEIIFLHGNKDCDKMWDRKIKTVVLGHYHTAITLKDKIKSEKYKCFLRGKYRNKTFIFVPSIIEYNAGKDIKNFSEKIPWKINFDNFEVIIIGEDNQNYNFGKLKEIF